MSFRDALLPIAAQVLTTTAVATNTAADFNTLTTEVDLQASQDCFIRLGVVTTTASTGHLIKAAAGVPYRFAIGSAKRISAVRSSVDGVLYVTELYNPKKRTTPL